MRSFNVNDIIQANQDLELQASDGKFVDLMAGDQCTVLGVTQRGVKLLYNERQVSTIRNLDPADFSLVRAGSARPARSAAVMQSQSFNVKDIIQANQDLVLQASDGKIVYLDRHDICVVLGVTQRGVKLLHNERQVSTIRNLDPADFDVIG